MALGLVTILFRKESTGHARGCDDDMLKYNSHLLSSSVLIQSWIGNKQFKDHTLSGSYARECLNSDLKEK